jgi:NADH-ubiquinone oxidoreductase chain 2
MIIISIITFIVAIALPTIKISSLNLARVSSIAFLFAAFLSFNVLYLESLRSGLGIYSGLYQVTAISQSIETFIYIIAAFILVPWFIKPLATTHNSQLRLNTATGLKATQFTNNVGPILPEYSLILLFSVLGASLLISSADLISMYLSIELQSFAVYLLAAIHRDSETATAAGLKYFLLGGLSSCFILLGAALIYAYTGLTNLESIFNLLLVVTNSTEGVESTLPLLGLLFIVLGFLFKVAAAPLHNWAPDVYDEVPSIVTTWLTIMPKISIFIFLFEIVNSALLGSTVNSTSLFSYGEFWSLPLKNVLLVSSLLSLIIGSVVGLAQYKIKRLLAYSTISHVGFLLLALGVNTEQSTESLIFYILQYSVTNLNTFLILLAFGYTLKSSKLGIGSTNSTYGSALDIKYISELKAQLINNPLLSLSLAICLFSMAGIPPLLGFFAKQQVLYAAMYNGYYFMSIVAILVSVISASYYLQIIKIMNFASETETDKNTVNTNISNSHSMLISLLSLSIVFFMLNPNILLNSTHLLALTVFQT